MIDKIKKIYRILKLVVAVLLIFAVVTGGFVATVYVSYTAGQFEACNAMLRQDPNTRRFGLYCEQMANGVVVRSTVLKKSLFNITTGQTYFILGN